MTNRGGALSSFLTWFHQYLSKCLRASPLPVEPWTRRRAETSLLASHTEVVAAIVEIISTPALAYVDERGTQWSLRSTLADCGVEALIVPAATAVRDGEAHVNDLFKAELTARLDVVNALWEERKTVEKLLGRSGRSLARFIFFDFRSTRAPGAGAEPESPPPDEPTPTDEPESRPE